MKQGRTLINFTMVLIAAVIAVYFTIYAFNSFQDPFTTTLAYTYTAHDSVEAQGVLARQEVVLPSQNGIVDLIRGEGEKVGVGQRLALVYRDSQAQSDQAELEALDLEIELLEYAAAEGGDTQSAARLDEDILQSVVTLRAASALDDYSLLEEQVMEIKSGVLKRGYIYGDGLTSAGLNARLQDLRGQRRTLEGRASASTSAVRAPKAGTFSSLVDGYEEILTPESIFSLTPAALKSILGGQRTSGGTGIGKLVISDRWYFAAVIPNQAAQRLREGGTALLRFSGDFSQDLDMTVEKIGAQEGDETLVIFSSNRYMGQTTLLRSQTAELIFDSWSGLRVPKGALRLLKETYTDENGQEQERSRLGVYVLMGGRAEFKGAEVAMEGGDYYVLRPTDNSSRALRAGDVVIVDGTGLYDGQLLEF